jgi:hypothetical protein
MSHRFETLMSAILHTPGWISAGATNVASDSKLLFEATAQLGLFKLIQGPSKCSACAGEQPTVVFYGYAGSGSEGGSE